MIIYYRLSGMVADLALILNIVLTLGTLCLLYTSDAADDLLCVDLGGRRIIKKQKQKQQQAQQQQ